MLKKILILVLALNTAYIPRAHSSTDLGARILLGLAGSASTIGGAWLLQKGCKGLWLNAKETVRLNKILSDMGAKVDIKSETKIEHRLGGTYWVQTTSRDLNTPQSFSEEEKSLAIKHWNLLVACEKDGEKMATKALLGFVLTPLGIFWLLASCVGPNQAA